MTFSNGQISAFGFKPVEWEHFLTQLGRTPTEPEAAACGALWSEHCSYKSTKKHLSRFHTKENWVWQGPGENAGVIGISENTGIVFKMESHNHPTYLEPYEGAATGVGGILRDVFCMGARPIANMNCLRFGLPEGCEKTSSTWAKHIVRRAVKGIADYGNCMGVPTVTGQTSFNNDYSANVLVNAFTAGVVEKSKLYKGVLNNSGEISEILDKQHLEKIKIQSILTTEVQNFLFPETENTLIYFGQATGRDGVHGATMSSSEFSPNSSSAEGLNHLIPTVQVGDPFAEKKLLEATLALIESGLTVGLQDMGAAGLTSSTVEMADRSGVGVALNLNLVPQRARNMQPTELLLSESQERMVCAVTPKNVDKVLNILKPFNVHVAVIGKVNRTGYFTCTFDNIVCVHLPAKLMVDGFYKWDHSVATESEYQKYYDKKQKILFEKSKLNFPEKLKLYERICQGISLADCLESEFKETLTESFSSLEFSSRASLTEHYCSTVQGQTIAGCGALQDADAAIIRVVNHDEPAGFTVVSFASGCEETWIESSPKIGAAQSTLRVARKCVASGSVPLAMTDCLNFGSPNQPHVMKQFSDAIDGINLVAKEFKIPVVSGNVSLNNQTDGHAIPPTPMIGVVGKSSVGNSGVGNSGVGNSGVGNSGVGKFGLKSLPSSTLKTYIAEDKEVQLIHINFKDAVKLGAANCGAGFLARHLTANTISPTTLCASQEKELWDFIIQSKESFILCSSVSHGGILGTALKLAFLNQCVLQPDALFASTSLNILSAEGQMGFVVGIESSVFKNFLNKLPSPFESLIVGTLHFKKNSNTNYTNPWDSFFKTISANYSSLFTSTYFS